MSLQSDLTTDAAAATPALTAQQTTIATTAEALGADVVASLYGITGAGEKIGIISDSFNADGGAATDMQNGILPNVDVLNDNTTGTDEGRAMIEIANSVAPGASYLTADGGTFAQNVTALTNAGANIIIDDQSFGNEALYQVGSAEDLAIEAAMAKNVNYFTAAGNNGNDYYEQGFAPLKTSIAGIGAVTASNFGGNSPYLSLTLPSGSNDINFQWAQPFASIGNGPGASNSLAVYLLDASGNIVASSTNDDVGADPSINLPFNNTTSGTAFRLVVVQNGGTVPSGQLFKFFLDNDVGTINSPNAGKGSGDLLGHELLPGVNVIAAVPYNQTPALGVSPATFEPFSSVGPGEILFDQNGNKLATPIISGEPQFAGVDNTITGSADTTEFADNPFDGTSAAAPSIGAVSALVLSANGALSTSQVTALLGQSRIPVAPNPGFNGSGLVQARAAVELGVADGGDRFATGKGGDWTTGADWSTGAAPGAGEAAGISDDLGAFSGTYTVTVDTTGDVAGSLAISAPAGSSATLLDTTGGSLNIGGAAAQTSAADAASTDPTKGDLLVSDNGALVVSGGVLMVASSLNVNDGKVTISLGDAMANNYAQNSGSLVIGGGSGTGELALTGTGFAETGGTDAVNNMGVLNTTVLTDSDGSLAIGSGGMLIDMGAATFTSGAMFTDDGSLMATSLSLTDTVATIDAGVTATVGSVVAVNTSTLFKSNLTVAGTLIDTGDLKDGTSFGGGTITVVTGGTLSVGGAVPDNVAIDFASNGVLDLASTNATNLQNFGGTILGLTLNNGAVDFTGLTFNAGDTTSYDAPSGQLVISDQSGNELADLYLSGTTNYATQTLLKADAAGHLEVVVACYARGTRILTAQGEVAVEDLQVGDLVTTTLDGEAVLKPVRWLGSRRLALRRHPHPDKANPVRIRAGALAEAVPTRDLVVSPGHRMRLGDTLICASDLVNGATIVQEAPDSVEYWHVELAAHDIILAEGAQAESYQDTGNRSCFEAGDVAVLHPVLDADVAEPCLPYGVADAALRETLALRAEHLGWRREREPLPWLDVNGRRVDPVCRNDRYRFSLPEGCVQAVLRSRDERPRDSSSTNDWRRLGVRLHRIALCGPDGTRDVALDHALLTDGFHDMEQEPEGWQARWTTGVAHLPVARLADGRRVSALEIAIDRGLLFWVAPADLEPAAALKLAQAA